VSKIKTFTITQPETAVISFEVMDEDVTTNEFVAFCSLSVSCIRSGLRTCELYDESGRRDGDFIFPSLLMHISIEKA
jgi:hypothetical protein